MKGSRQREGYGEHSSCANERGDDGYWVVVKYEAAAWWSGVMIE
jgi:hypothetical protein